MQSACDFRRASGFSVGFRPEWLCVSREWRISVVLPGWGGQSIEACLGSLEQGGLDVERDGDHVCVFVDAPHSVKRVEKQVLHVLHEHEFASLERILLKAERWDAELDNYVDPEHPEGDPGPAVSPDQIGWLVGVLPCDVSRAAKVRQVLKERRRMILNEHHGWIDVAARDEADAEQLIDEMEALPEVNTTRTRRLGWFARWRLRQRLLGNYVNTDAGDPLEW